MRGGYARCELNTYGTNTWADESKQKRARPSSRTGFSLSAFDFRQRPEAQKADRLKPVLRSIRVGDLRGLSFCTGAVGFQSAADVAVSARSGERLGEVSP